MEAGAYEPVAAGITGSKGRIQMFRNWTGLPWS
jgi:hypothetical protein